MDDNDQFDDVDDNYRFLLEIISGLVQEVRLSLLREAKLFLMMLSGCRA